MAVVQVHPAVANHAETSMGSTITLTKFMRSPMSTSVARERGRERERDDPSTVSHTLRQVRE
ncbi:MAG: hypothetical protein ACREX8_00100 [Gammaproteobacteria bacterium]